MAAATVSKQGHVSGAFDGNAAYDLNHPAFQPQRYGQPQIQVIPGRKNRQQEQAERQTRVQTRTRVRSHAKNRQALAPMALLGFGIAAVLLVFSLMARIQLIAVTDGTVELESQLSELQTENAKLQIAYESAFNLTEIEDYATRVLGMQQPRSDQVYYVNGTAVDRAEVMVEQTGEQRLSDRFDDLIASVGEYFQ
ncbi:MAG: hypothetical protein MR033_02585 [Clostridiales bacterium]|nr:hypothetical protein [Clostridiales bacterium]